VSTSAQPRDAPQRARAIGQAFREAGRFDRAQVSARAGLIAAIPVAAMLALGTAIGSPSVAATMGAGAMLTGVAWRAGNGPLIPPIGTMAGAALALGAATLAGTLSGRWAWLHLVLLVVFCLVAGSAASLGRRGLVVGTQSVIAFIVFGRFPENLAHALALTGLVLGGGAAQVLFAATVAVPLAWRRQRAALAAAYGTLAKFTDEDEPFTAPMAAAFDDADKLLAAPAFFADPDRKALAALIPQGRRIRLELIAFRSLLAQLRRTDLELSERSADSVRLALRRVHALLELTGAAISGDGPAFAQLPGQAAQVAEWGTAREPLPSVALDERLAALIGQVTAAARLAAALRAPDSTRLTFAGRPTLGTRRFGSQIAADVRRMRSGTAMHTAAGRHAVRLAVVVALTELLVQRVALPRAYWAVVAASTVLRPDFGQTFTRGAERVLGTMAGVVIATLIAVALDPNGWGVVAVVAILACITYAVFPASFAVGVAMLTGLVVFLLHAVSPDSAQTALDRGIDTAIGGAIGLIAYLLWPTWSAVSISPLLATLVDAEHSYLEAVLTGLTIGRRMPEAELRTLARGTRIAYMDAQAAIELARSEPGHAHGGADPRVATTVLGALQRVVDGIHVLRLDATTMLEAKPLPALAPLQAGLGESLSILAVTLRDSALRPFPPLRTLDRDLMRARPELLSQAVWAALDELVDAIDTVAATVGLTGPWDVKS
jgi:uncharacterized membrane protein YccC